MKKNIIIIALLALIASVASAQRISKEDFESLSLVNANENLQGPLTGLNIVSSEFVVDKDLPAPKTIIPAYDDQWVAKKIIGTAGIPDELQRVVKTSFEGQRMGYMGKDNFFKCFVQAYADHRPLVLSPDVVWLIISQGFSRYVNAHTEEMRDLLVFHEGKKDLVVNSNNDVLSPNADWELLLNDFSACIAENTKGELADLVTADFTTTGITERIASQISLMDVVKEYFNYLNVAISCGIPSITLKGSPDDWQKVLDKARCLKKYNLEKWARDLEVILEEFVKASKGRANQKFWQNIVKKKRVDQLQADRGCLPNLEKTTKLDGWFLKFFPNAEGETSDSVLWNTSMPEEMVRVPFKQVYVHPVTGEVVKTVPMELWAGFVGVEEDPKTRSLMPKIGWLARIADEQAEETARQKEEEKWRLKVIERPKLKEGHGLPIPTREVTKSKKAKKKKGVKAGKKISGIVSDEFGPLVAATVCEVSEQGRIVASTITDFNGHFTLKVVDPQDKIRISYVGLRTVMLDIDKKKYDVLMESAITLRPVPITSKIRVH